MTDPNLFSFSQHLGQFSRNSRLSFTGREVGYLFGRNPELSLGELIAGFHILSETPQFLDLSPTGAIVKSTRSLDISTCGSLLKRVIPLTSVPWDTNIADFSSHLSTVLSNHFIKEFFEDKLSWTISFYDSNLRDLASKGSNSLKEQIPTPSWLSQIGMAVKSIMKDLLKQMGVKKPFFLGNEGQDAADPQRLIRKGIPTNGFELIIFNRPSETLICRTDQILDIDAFEVRDRQRPFQRPLLSLGLALARTMVNLTAIEQCPEPSLIFDPFCGMGSIVAEAYLLGYMAYGSDIDPSCVAQSRQNLHWLTESSPYHKQISPFDAEQFFQMDLTSPFPSHLAYNGSIVTEPNLLAPLPAYPTPTEGSRLVSEFTANYTRYLQGIQQILSARGVCVMIFPRIHTNLHSRISLPVHSLLDQFGFEICQISLDNWRMPAYFVHNWKQPIIERDIVVFKHRSIH